MKITHHGHSCIQISDDRHSVIIDPFLSGNPVAVSSAEEIKVNFVLLTHGHGDHTSDAEIIARANDATIIATYELATYFERRGLKAVGMNLGGTFDLGFAKVKMTQAFHSSSIFEEDGQIIYTGMPAGYLIYWDKYTFFHTGDTALFGDMKMIGELNRIDYCFLPIGDLFTMGPTDALIAAQWLQVKHVIPVHHNTFDAIAQDVSAFCRDLSAKGIQGIPMSPGDQYQVE